ncbi:hypothetical protein DM02DRAFT_125998 [Periconia macrospinosa]|uniref:Uncharacterized protein n=1 Tax=Periconia macrospinosa TaxID=97972 RepID=A0A2V1E3E3_9PLEO|nr:hypothetical protein DM02DRAFT_125998 [Periconia macrospinosa]
MQNSTSCKSTGNAKRTSDTSLWGQAPSTASIKGPTIHEAIPSLSNTKKKTKTPDFVLHATIIFSVGRLGSALWVVGRAAGICGVILGLLSHLFMPAAVYGRFHPNPTSSRLGSEHTRADTHDKQSGFESSNNIFEPSVSIRSKLLSDWILYLYNTTPCWRH